MAMQLRPAAIASGRQARWVAEVARPDGAAAKLRVAHEEIHADVSPLFLAAGNGDATLVHALLASALPPDASIISRTHRLCFSGSGCEHGIFCGNPAIRVAGPTPHKVDEALQVWAEMTEMGVKPDTHGYSSFLIGLCDCGKYDLANVILQEITREKVPVEAMAYNMIMDGLCKEMRLDEAEKLLENKARQGSTPDNAQQVFEEMMKANVEPDIVTYNILASGFCKSGLVMEVFDLLDHMMDQGLEPNSLTYGIAIVGFCRGGNLSEAEVNIADEELSVEIRKENEAPVVESKVKNISDTNNDLANLFDPLAIEGLSAAVKESVVQGLEANQRLILFLKSTGTN
ncbi:hypothetical protein E2562_000825 [Oryza meyeriana var. granulata]|uniref:Pentacotripeptide-repeat region of PRORP domain-containing protein n=1 Tax=Oryza meyeriana var. granulata TaxID=110450 RepID=A0A6G1CZW0_9ORYZ|nr:hypothetical protein E2562_000825 [Oryza meyeriana var. granulata]